MDDPRGEGGGWEGVVLIISNAPPVELLVVLSMYQ
jgi:hypothetical protein